MVRPGTLGVALEGHGDSGVMLEYFILNSKDNPSVGRPESLQSPSEFQCLPCS